MKEDILVRVYKNDEKYRGVCDIESVGCTLAGIPGMRKISYFQEMLTNSYGIIDYILSLRISFFGEHGEIGYRFLYSALEDSRYWSIRDLSNNDYLVEDDWSAVPIFARSIFIIAKGHFNDEASEDLLRCINSEIRNPKWIEHINNFDLHTDISFIKVK